MIVITRNGRTTVITGWRAWLIGAAVFAFLTVLLFLIVFLMAGVAFTVGAVLLIVVPVAVGLALIASVFRPRV